MALHFVLCRRHWSSRWRVTGKPIRSSCPGWEMKLKRSRKQSMKSESMFTHCHFLCSSTALWHYRTVFFFWLVLLVLTDISVLQSLRESSILTCSSYVTVSSVSHFHICGISLWHRNITARYTPAWKGFNVSFYCCALVFGVFIKSEQSWCSTPVHIYNVGKY